MTLPPGPRRSDVRDHLRLDARGGPALDTVRAGPVTPPDRAVADLPVPDAPVAGPPATPDGSLLSCYTASLAQAMCRRGLDWAGVIGLSSVFALRPAGDGLFAFAHHAYSLRDRLARGLRRTGTDDPDELADGLARAHRRLGWVIVSGDTFHLPWCAGHRRRHAPHWFVLDGRRDGSWHVTDPFAMVNEDGEQAPWHGWVDAGRLSEVFRAVADPLPEQALRERFAFGDDDPRRLAFGYQWFTTAPAGPTPPHAGRPPAPWQAHEGWLTGATAVRRVRDHVTEVGH
ncbi:MAG TPA: hypothetical protein VNV66_12605, partial [Pilimelia sp.]|nr:hypothetical protein [Pilimelia sp.]